MFLELEVDKLIYEEFLESRGHKVSHVNCVLAMVLNGLGFVGMPLCFYPESFKNVLVDIIFLGDIQKEDLNQYVIRDFKGNHRVIVFKF